MGRLGKAASAGRTPGGSAKPWAHTATGGREPSTCLVYSLVQGNVTLLWGFLPLGCGWIRSRAGSFVIRLLYFGGGVGNPSTIPRMLSIGLKLLDDGDSHSIEQQHPPILRSLHDRRHVIPNAF